jgi:hypothetical protein
MGFNLDTDNVGTNDAAFVCFGTPKVSSITSSSSAYTWGYDFDEGTDWKVWEILWQEGTANFYVDDVLRQTHTSNVPSIALPVTISAYSGDPTINVDWILVRKYSAVEPQIVTGPIEPYTNAADNFDDNRRGALWRYSCTNYFAVSLVEDSNRLNLISAGDANDSDAFYASNGWRFDPNEDFGLQVDFHFDHSGQADSWVGLVVEDENNLILVSAGCENGDPYYWYEAITDTHTLRERLPRSSTDGKFSIWYEADSNNLYMSHSGSDLADPCATPRSVTCVSNSSFRLLLGGGSDGAVLSMGESFLDNFMVTYAVLADWPPMTDLDQDGFIGYGDLFILCDHWLDRLSEAVYFDFVWDGTIDFSDFAALAASWLQADRAIDVVPIPAGDGIVDTFEFAVFSTYWLAEVPIQTVLVGDFNYDGAVDFLDWAEFALAW